MEIIHVHNSDNELFPKDSIESADKLEDALIINCISQL